MRDLRHRIPFSLVLVCLVAGLAVGSVSGDGTAPCLKVVEEGHRELRGARYRVAETLFEQIGDDPACALEARVGLAAALGGRGQRKQALKLARSVVEATGDPSLLSRAWLVIGRALDEPSRKWSRRVEEVERAYLRVAELGEDAERRAAVRALAQVYRETRQEERLAGLRERYPELGILGLEERRALLAPEKKDLPVEIRKFLCVGPQEELVGEEKGYRSPKITSFTAPEYTDEARKKKVEGIVVLRILVNTKASLSDLFVFRKLDPELDQQAKDAARDWVFESGKDPEGKPAQCWLEAEVRFKMK